MSSPAALRRSARALARRGGALLAAIVLLVGVLRAGASYFYCPMMQATFDAPCCDRGHHDEGDDDGAPGIDHAACCEGKRLGALPTSERLHESEPVATAPITGVTPAVPAALDGPLARPAARDLYPARAGPQRASARRATLMIWNS